jgi:phosphatidyl-myo-inositol alpha-mannosyltransferase
MRICLVTPYDLSHDGGVNRHVMTLAHALGRLGHQTRVLGPASGPTPPRCDSLPGVVALPANGSCARVGLFVSRRAVQDYLERGGFDLIHVHEPWVPGPSRYALQHGVAPIVATFHTYAESESGFTRLVRRALARPLRRLDCAIAVSNLAADFARGVFDGPIHVVPNGIEPAAFAAPSALLDADGPGVPPREPGPLRLLFVGRFDEPRKGLCYFLRAVSLLRRRGHAIEGRIVGHGDPQPYAALARQAGVRFFGRVDDRTLVEMYRWCDIFCAPSTHGESFGIVLIEAMASGRPVVASDIPGYRDATVGAAILVPPADEILLADAILRAAGDEGLRQKVVQQGWQRAHQLAWSRLVLNINFLYEGVAADRLARRGAVEISA